MTTRTPNPWEILTQAQLVALGLDPNPPQDHDIQVLALPTDDDTSTRALAPPAAPTPPPTHSFFDTDHWLDTIADLDWSEPLPLRTAQALGLEVSRARDQPHLWSIEAPHHPLTLRPSAPSPTPGHHLDPDDPRVAYLDMRALAGALRIDTQGGAMILMVHQGDCLAFPLPTALLAPALDQWLQESTDAWLKDYLGRYSRHQDWDKAVCAGLYGRLCQHSPEIRQRAVDHILSGTLDPLAHAPWRWAAALDKSAVDALMQRAQETCAQLQGQFLALGLIDDDDSDLPLDDPQWALQWRDCLYLRDDLESVACLLRHHRRGRGALDAALQTLDRTGALFAAALPLFDEILGDERLLRAAGTAPDLWWTLPAIETPYTAP